MVYKIVKKDAHCRKLRTVHVMTNLFNEYQEYPKNPIRIPSIFQIVAIDQITPIETAKCTFFFL